MSNVELNTAVAYDTAICPVNTVCVRADQTEFMFVQAGSAITSNAAVSVNSAGSAVNLTSTTHNKNYTAGVAMATMASGQYGWVAISNLKSSNVSVTVAAGSVLESHLYTTATAGTLGTDSTGQVKVWDRSYITSTSTAGGNKPVVFIP